VHQSASEFVGHIIAYKMCINPTSLSLQTYNHIEVMRWFLVCVIGILTGFVAFLIIVVVHSLVDKKYAIVERGQCCHGNHSYSYINNRVCRWILMH